MAVYRLQDGQRSARRPQRSYIGLALWEYTRLLAAANRYMEDYSEPLSFQGNPVSLSTAVQIAGWHPSFTKQERDLLFLTFVRRGSAARMLS
jgi:hypothetical protein